MNQSKMHPEGSLAASMLVGAARTLASGAVERQLALQPDAVDRYGRNGQTLLRDTEVRFGYLAEAVATDRLALLSGQLGWLKILCAARGVDLALIHANLECMLEEVMARLPETAATLSASLLAGAIEAFEDAPTEASSHLEGERPHIGLAREFLLAVLEMRESDAIGMILEAFDAGVPMHEIHEHVLGRVQAEVGRMWQMCEVSIAEEHYCTEVVSGAAAVLRSRVPRPEPNGRQVIAAAVTNETHDLGIRLVTQAFEMRGWRTVNLGANNPASAVADAVRDFGGDLIALSANIVLYVRQAERLIRSLRERPETRDVPILVGGQPFNLVEDLWDVIGADGHARSAMESPIVGESLVGVGA